jgi:2-amino-4-hydroxy-6-hydroxymethyldihydropteridine diphosphokinase
LKDELQIIQISSVYELSEGGNAQRSVLATTDAERWAGGLSVVLKVRTELPPQELLEVLQRVERQANLTTRCVDIDLLFYEKLSTMTPSLTLPHPEMHRRPQVLIPAAEIAPDYSHPVLGQDLLHLTHRFEKSPWGRYYSTGKTLLDFSPGRQ